MRHADFSNPPFFHLTPQANDSAEIRQDQIHPDRSESIAGSVAFPAVPHQNPDRTHTIPIAPALTAGRRIQN